jgi:hypothetical protein
LRSCHLQKSLRDALQAFFNSLDGKTLNDVTPKSPAAR